MRGERLLFKHFNIQVFLANPTVQAPAELNKANLLSLTLQHFNIESRSALTQDTLLEAVQNEMVNVKLV